MATAIWAKMWARGKMEEGETDVYVWKSAHRAANIAKARGQLAMRANAAEANASPVELSSALPWPEEDRSDEHASVLHACEDAPLQSAPPFVGGGTVQLRLWMPPPQLAEHVPKSVQPPFVRGA
jgi:hypothetical protein